MLEQLDKNWILEKNNKIYFIRTVLKALEEHFLQETFPAITFIWFALILDLHLLQTKMFLNNLAFASGNFAILTYSFLIDFITLSSRIVQ